MRVSRKVFISGALLGLSLVLAIGIARVVSPRPGIDAFSGYRVIDTRLPRAGTVKVTFLGTTTLLFDDGATQFMVDGFLSRPGILRSVRLNTAPAVVDATLSRAGVDAALFRGVIVSHTHADHAMDAVYIVKKFSGAALYGSPSAHQLGCGGGLPDARNRVVKPMDKIELGDFAVTVLPATHAPRPKYPGEVADCLAQPAWAWQYREGASYDFLIRHGTLSILFRGGANVVWPLIDTQQVDVMFISVAQVGTADERFARRYFEDALARWRPRLVIPMHWDDYFAPLSADLRFSAPIEDDSRRALDELLARIDALNLVHRPSRPHVDFRMLQGFDGIVVGGDLDGRVGLR